MAKALEIGAVGSGVLHTDQEVPDVDTKFRMVKEAGVFDYFDRSPPMGELDLYLNASQKYGVPIKAGGWFYTLGRDEPLLEWNLRIAKEVGARVHNVQIMTNDAKGRPVSDDDVVRTYLWAAEKGDRFGVDPCLEVHVNMWSEHFARVAKVARAVEARGIRFNMTLDHSHVIFKIDNPKEQEVQDMRADVESGRVILDPFRKDSVTRQWIAANWVRHAHARPAVPNNPVNVWAKHPNGRFGRGIQYPFMKPKQGEWHSDWQEERLEPWKQVLRDLLEHHARAPDSRLGQISTEMIPSTDYGAGAKSSIFEHNVAVARWIRETWNEISRRAAA